MHMVEFWYRVISTKGQYCWFVHIIRSYYIELQIPRILTQKKLGVIFTRNNNHTIGVVVTPQFWVFSAHYPSSEGNFLLLPNGPCELWTVSAITIVHSHIQHQKTTLGKKCYWIKSISFQKHVYHGFKSICYRISNIFIGSCSIFLWINSIHAFGKKCFWFNNIFFSV